MSRNTTQLTDEKTRAVRFHIICELLANDERLVDMVHDVIHLYCR